MTGCVCGLDIDLASQVQELLFPKSSPVCTWGCIAAKFRMANKLGGDYFEFLALPDGCQVVLIGDVTGHGLHASVVMSLLYGFIHHAGLGQCSPLNVSSEVNEFLNKISKRSEKIDYFFSTTFFCAVIHPETLRMRYVNAGQAPPLVRRGSDIIELQVTAPPLGFFADPEIEMKTFQFEKHDRMLLCTDGIIESLDRHGNLFGKKRLKDFLRHRQSNHMVFLEELFSEIDVFSRGVPQNDDRTAICVDFREKVKAATI